MLILNTRLVENGIITPIDEENRNKKDEKHRLNTREQFSQIVNYIKQESFDMGENVFCELRIDWIKKNFEFAETNDITTLVFQLKNDPNIICKEMGIVGEGTLSRKPQLYRWVPKEEKKTMGFDAVAYRNIPEYILEYLKTEFKDYNSTPAEILAVIDRLVLEGADKGWVTFSPLRICGRSGIPLGTIQNVLDDLHRNNCILLYEQTQKDTYKNRKPCTVVLVFSQKEREARLYQAQSQNIEIFTPVKKSRTRKPTNYERRERIATSIKDELTAAGLLEEKLEKEEKPEKENENIVAFSGRRREKAFNKTSLIPEELHDLNVFLDKQATLLNNLVGNMTYAFSKQREQFENETDQKVTELAQKVLSTEAEIVKKNEEIAQLKARLEQEKELNNEFLANLTETVMEFQGGLMSVIESFARKPSYLKNDNREVNKFKMEVFNLSQKLSENLIKWSSKEKKVPNLI